MNMSKSIKAVLSSDLAVLGSDGFVDPSATAEAVAMALEAHVTREREIDRAIGVAVEMVYDAAPVGQSFSSDLLKAFVTSKAEAVGLTISEVNDGFQGWHARNVVDHRHATPGNRYVSKRGPGEGIRRMK